MEKKKTEKYGGANSRGMNVLDEICNTIDKHGIPTADVLESFAIYARRINITRFLAHYELYKMIKDLPGCIVECGVYQGNSLFAFAKFLEIFHPGDRIRHVIGFDSFQGLTDFTEKDGPMYPNRSKVKGGWSAGDFKDAFYELVDLYHEDMFVPQAKRVQIVEGNILETVPKYVNDHPGLRISLLHLDVDIYEPNLCALKHLYPRVVPGGLVVLDEYAMTEWGGESSAFEDYFGEKMPVMKKFPWTSTPGGYFIKE
ncbi:TylF/MycF/NovP-related O-methyltransferase [Alteromonas gracilis]|uniref:TylF/MycF/NovP-related O-methyltransferase n=1 Tax=Alteromonas gracilis TaxID=1479524 RepID=UPI0030D1BAC9